MKDFKNIILLDNGLVHFNAEDLTGDYTAHELSCILDCLFFHFEDAKLELKSRLENACSAEIK